MDHAQKLITEQINDLILALAPYGITPAGALVAVQEYSTIILGKTAPDETLAHLDQLKELVPFDGTKPQPQSIINTREDLIFTAQMVASLRQ